MLAQNEEPIFPAARSYAYAAGSKTISRKAGVTSLRSSAAALPAIPTSGPTPTFVPREMIPSTTRSYAQVAKAPKANPNPKSLTPPVKSAAPLAPSTPAVMNAQNPSKAMGRYRIQQKTLATRQTQPLKQKPTLPQHRSFQLATHSAKQTKHSPNPP